MSLFQRTPCTNCGSPVYNPDHCRMIDRCIESQNKVVWDTLSGDDMRRLLAEGKRIFKNQPRPLCKPCGQENSFICYWCDLEVNMEVRKA